MPAVDLVYLVPYPLSLPLHHLGENTVSPKCRPVTSLARLPFPSSSLILRCRPHRRPCALPTLPPPQPSEHLQRRGTHTPPEAAILRVFSRFIAPRIEIALIAGHLPMQMTQWTWIGCPSSCCSSPESVSLCLSSRSEKKTDRSLVDLGRSASTPSNALSWSCSAFESPRQNRTWCFASKRPRRLASFHPRNTRQTP